MSETDSQSRLYSIAWWPGVAAVFEREPGGGIHYESQGRLLFLILISKPRQGPHDLRRLPLSPARRGDLRIIQSLCNLAQRRSPDPHWNDYGCYPLGPPDGVPFRVCCGPERSPVLGDQLCGTSFCFGHDCFGPGLDEAALLLCKSGIGLKLSIVRKWYRCDTQFHAGDRM